MTYFRIIAFLAILGAAVGVNGYLEKQYNVSIFSALKGTNIGGFVKNLLTPTTPKGPGGGVPAETVNYGPCNSSGACDNAGEICQPVNISNKTELRCVPTAPFEKIPADDKIATSKEPVSKPSGTVSKPPVPSQSSLPIQTTPATLIAPTTPITLTSSYGKGKVRISGASPSYSFSYPSTITLYATLNTDEKVNIGGWRIKTKREEVIMPQAIEVYEPSGLAPSQDITLKYGDYVYLYSSKSSINRNFKTNKCMGYLENTYRFQPPLSTSCPALYRSRSDIVDFTSRCQDYITSLYSCVEPSPAPPVPVDDTACRDFLRQVNYGGCFNKYSKDADFLSREWKIYLNLNPLDPSHDRVQLINKSGTVVDEYFY